MQRGDLGPARDSYGDPTGPGADNGYAIYLAVQCTDAPWPQAWGTWAQGQLARLRHTAPFVTWGNAWYNAPVPTGRRPRGQAGQGQRHAGPGACC